MQFVSKLILRIAQRNFERFAYKFAIKDWTRLSDLDALARALDSKRFSENLAPIAMEKPTGKRILALAAHPDDDVFGAGGTLLRCARSGASIHTLCFTTGERAGGETVARVREEESQRVAQKLGSTVDYLRYPARSSWVSDAAQGELKQRVHAFRPDTIFLPFLADDHEDHRRVSELFYTTFRDNAPSCEIWAYQVYSTVLPNVIVDITDVIEDKLALVWMYDTQMAHRDWAHYLRGLHAFNARFLKTNEPRYAEMFFVVPSAAYLSLCASYFPDR